MSDNESGTDKMEEGGSLQKREVNFEKDILRVINPMGKFQKWTITWALFVDMPPAMFIMFFLFGGANPGYICQSPVPHDPQLNQTMIYSLEDNFNWTVNSSSQLNVCSVNGTECAYRRYIGQSTSVITEWDLVCEKKIYNVLINTALMAGMFVGAFIFGHLADSFGRRTVVFPALAGMVLSQFLLAFVNMWQLFLFLRFVMGAFAGGLLVITFTLPMELLDSKWRTICVIFNGWPFGTCFLVLLAYFIRDWRHLCIACSLCGLPALAGFFVIPESPCWLIQKGRFADAEVVLRRIARINGRPEPDYSLLPQICASSQQEEAEHKAHTFVDLFRTRRLTINICVMAVFWFTVSTSYYGLAMNLPSLSGDIYVNTTILALMALPFNLSVIVTAKWFGRKRATAGYMLLGSIALFSLLLTRLAPPSTALIYLQTVLCQIGQSSFSSAWLVAQLVNSEIFPTLIRNIATGVCSTVVRFGGIIAPYIAYLVYVHPSLPYFIFGLMSMITAVAIMMFIPETLGLPLPDDLPDWTDHCSPCCGSKYKKADVDLKAFDE